VTARLLRPALFPRIDQTRKETVMNKAETWNADYERRCRMRRHLGQKNKAAIFAALAAAEIELVLVSFDGEGDSGQVQDVDASRHEQPVALPEVKVTLLQAVWGKVEAETISTVRDSQHPVLPM
jgi:hypothetical protein